MWHSRHLDPVLRMAQISLLSPTHLYQVAQCAWAYPSSFPIGIHKGYVCLKATGLVLLCTGGSGQHTQVMVRGPLGSKEIHGWGECRVPAFHFWCHDKYSERKGFRKGNGLIRILISLSYNSSINEGSQSRNLTASLPATPRSITADQRTYSQRTKSGYLEDGAGSGLSSQLAPGWHSHVVQNHLHYGSHNVPRQASFQ